MMRLLRYWLMVMLITSNSQADTNQQTLTFGIVPQQSAAKLARNWTPLLEHLSAQTGHQLQFKTAPDISEFEHRFSREFLDRPCKLVSNQAVCTGQ